MAFDLSIFNCPTCGNTCIKVLDGTAVEIYCSCGRMGAKPKAESKKGTWFTNILEEEED